MRKLIGIVLLFFCAISCNQVNPLEIAKERNCTKKEHRVAISDAKEIAINYFRSQSADVAAINLSVDFILNNRSDLGLSSSTLKYRIFIS